MIAALKGKQSSSEKAQNRQVITEQRIVAIKDLVERFLYDLVCLLAGHSAEMGYVDPHSVAILQQEVTPFLNSDERLRPDLGEWGKVMVKDDEDKQVAVVQVEFEEQSIQTNKGNARKRHPVRWITLQLLVSGDARLIKALRFKEGRISDE